MRNLSESSSTTSLQGRYSGNALGFKLRSLLILSDTRSSDPQRHLLHFLVEAAEAQRSGALDFLQGLRHHLTDASRYRTPSLVLTFEETNSHQSSRVFTCGIS